MKLSAWLSQHEITDADMADRLGVSRQALWRYRAGDRMPRPAVLAKIHEVTAGAVTANDFMPSQAEAAA